MSDRDTNRHTNGSSSSASSSPYSSSLVYEARTFGDLVRREMELNGMDPNETSRSRPSDLGPRSTPLIRSQQRQTQTQQQIGASVVNDDDDDDDATVQEHELNNEHIAVPGMPGLRQVESNNYHHGGLLAASRDVSPNDTRFGFVEENERRSQNEVDRFGLRRAVRITDNDITASRRSENNYTNNMANDDQEAHDQQLTPRIRPRMRFTPYLGPDTPAAYGSALVEQQERAMGIRLVDIFHINENIASHWNRASRHHLQLGRRDLVSNASSRQIKIPRIFRDHGFGKKHGEIMDCANGVKVYDGSTYELMNSFTEALDRRSRYGLSPKKKQITTTKNFKKKRSFDDMENANAIENSPQERPTHDLKSLFSPSRKYKAFVPCSTQDDETTSIQLTPLTVDNSQRGGTCFTKLLFETTSNLIHFIKTKIFPIPETSFIKINPRFEATSLTLHIETLDFTTPDANYFYTPTTGQLFPSYMPPTPALRPITNQQLHQHREIHNSGESRRNPSYLLPLGIAMPPIPAHDRTINNSSNNNNSNNNNNNSNNNNNNNNNSDTNNNSNNDESSSEIDFDIDIHAIWREADTNDASSFRNQEERSIYRQERDATIKKKDYSAQTLIDEFGQYCQLSCFKGYVNDPLSLVRNLLCDDCVNNLNERYAMIQVRVEIPMDFFEDDKCWERGKFEYNDISHMIGAIDKVRGTIEMVGVGQSLIAQRDEILGKSRASSRRDLGLLRGDVNPGEENEEEKAQEKERQKRIEKDDVCGVVRFALDRGDFGSFELR